MTITTNLKVHYQYTSTGSHTTIYLKLVQLSRRKGPMHTSVSHSQAGYQVRQYLGWWYRGVNE